MKDVELTDERVHAIAEQLGQSNLFRELAEAELAELARNATMREYEPNEVVFRQGETSDDFCCVASGEAVITIKHEATGEEIEVARLQPFDVVGELGLLLDDPRSGTARAGREALVLLVFSRAFFERMFQAIPRMGLILSRMLAQRFKQASRKLLLPLSTVDTLDLDPATVSILPADFIQRHRVLPIKGEGNLLEIGFVEDPTPQLMNLVRERLPGMQLKPVLIDVRTFNEVLQHSVAQDQWREAGAETADAQEAAAPESVTGGASKLDQLLRRMVAEHASDLHLSSGQRPRWRIDGTLYEIADAPVPGSEELLKLIDPVMPERNRTIFEQDHDTDFAYSIPNISRFRVNLFRDLKGVGAVFRQIPNRIFSVEQLGLPDPIHSICEIPTGLVLVTGPSRCGKSTTLAAIIDSINKNRQAHIITLEDPIEFIHHSAGCLVNQREVGSHTGSFARALRAALREDPDVILVGEMSDLETVSLAIETANTGHLVFGILRTHTAIGAIAQIVDMFPADEQGQIRGLLSKTIKGVIAQTLCKRIGGGRAAALEIMVPDPAMAALMRDGKTDQLMNAMRTGRTRGNRVLNNELARLVSEGVIEPEEALSRAVDKYGLARALGYGLAQAMGSESSS